MYIHQYVEYGMDGYTILQRIKVTMIYICWVVIDVFIIIIKQIVFFWYDCYRRWQGKETQLRSQSFILEDTIQ